MGEPATREHEQQRGGNAEGGHAAGHGVQVLAGQRLDVGVGHRGRGALVLADLRGDLVGGRHRGLRMPAGDQGGGPGLVAGVRVGVQEHDRDRRDAGVDQPLRPRRDLADVELAGHRAVGAEALGDLQPQVARHQRLRPGDVEVVQLELALATDLERVGEAGGGDETGDGAAALDERVGEERRGVHHPRELAGRQAMLPQQRVDAGRDGARRIVVGGEDLAVELTPAGVVVHHDVGERAADVDAERVAHFLSVRSSTGAAYG